MPDRDFYKNISLTNRTLLGIRLLEFVTELDKADDQIYPKGTAWYALHCYIGREAQVKQNLLYRVKAMGLEAQIFRVVVAHTPGQFSSKPDFPGYVFVKLVPAEEARYVVKNTPGVAGWVKLDIHNMSQVVSSSIQGGMLSRWLHKRQAKRQTKPTELQIKAAIYNLQGYKLGQYVEISLSVVDLGRSVAFYEKLGLRQVDGETQPYPWAVVSDGTLHLGLHQTPFSSPKLTYFASYTPDQLAALKTLGIPLNDVQSMSQTTGMIDGEVVGHDFMVAADFTAYEGQPVSLVSKNIVADPDLDRHFFAADLDFGELSFRTADVEAAVDYWLKLGFECLDRKDKPYPSAIVSDGLIRLGLHQTNTFHKPTISYFAADMLHRLQRLRAANISFIVEHKDNKGQRVGAALKSPDGQPFFLFTGQNKAALTKKPNIFKPLGGWEVED